MTRTIHDKLRRASVLLVALAWLLAGCEGQVTIVGGNEVAGTRAPQPGPPAAELSPAPQQLEAALQQPNYAGGSCVHASMINVLRMCGYEQQARAWRQEHSGGCSSQSLIAYAHRAGLSIAYTHDASLGFLQWCDRTRRPAVLFYHTNHCVTFLRFDAGRAVLVDNNHVGREARIDMAAFLRNWRGYGGFALTVVDSPAPPRPW